MIRGGKEQEVDPRLAEAEKVSGLERITRLAAIHADKAVYPAADGIQVEIRASDDRETVTIRVVGGEESIGVRRGGG